MKNVFKKVGQQVVGFLLVPLFLTLYFGDRAICLLIPTVNNFDIRIWFSNQDEIRNSIIRCVVVSVLIALFFGVKFLINKF